MISLTGKIEHFARMAKVLLSLNVNEGTYLEIGAHKGRSISAMSNVLLSKVEKLHTIGYDLFDQEPNDFHKTIEDNGKGAGNYEKCNRNLSKILKRNDNFSYELIKGFTTDTLVEQSVEWAFIDGGHSYETVKHDHEKLKNSKVIVFDDADLYGVNQYLWSIKDDYKLYDLPSTKLGMNRQVVIVNDIENFNFDTAEMQDFGGMSPENWQPIR